MDAKKLKKIKEKGWGAGSVADFLDLPLDVEAMVAELSERRRPKR